MYLFLPSYLITNQLSLNSDCVCNYREYALKPLILDMNTFSYNVALTTRNHIHNEGTIEAEEIVFRIRQ